MVPVAWMADGHCGCRTGAGCAHPAKHPLSRGGLKAATTDPARLDEWWGHWPAAGVGIVTGTRSGIVVVDVDPAHGGNDSLSSLQEAGVGLPRTLYARTGGGGWHLFYAAPEAPVANSIGRLGRRELPGIDLRGEDGYV
ncbi:MAG: bifunctional DNA primase/polymerase, partial [Acidimicrobiales bacterium]